MTLKQGQTLWYVSERWSGARSDGCEVTVVKVGRIWATLKSGERINKDTLCMADWGGYCYLSREHYEEQRRVKDAWHRLQARMTTPPPGVTEANIIKAAELLGVTLPLPAPRKP